MPNPLNSTGYFIVPAISTYKDMAEAVVLSVGTIVLQDSSNPAKALCMNTTNYPSVQAMCDYVGQCGFSPEITTTTLLFPNCPEIYALDVILGGSKIYATTLTLATLEANMEAKDVVFTNVKGTSPENMIGFESVRDATTNPTLDEVNSWYAEYVMFGGSVLTFGGEVIKF